jgi:hypothetical protein
MIGIYLGDNLESVIITKKIAKQGKNLVLIIPKDIHNLIKQGDLVKVSIDVLEDGT